MAAPAPGAVKWLRGRDPSLSALRRAARAAIVMPGLFALADKLLANAVVGSFAAFGAFAMLLLVDFSGPRSSRLRAEAALAVAGGALVCLGTLASRSAWEAVPAMVVVGFAVLFSAAVSSVLAGATTALLLAFILPVSLPAPASAVPDRLAGWALAAVASIFAVAFLWPASSRDPLRRPVISACRSLAARLRAGGPAPRPSPGDGAPGAGAAGAVAPLGPGAVPPPDEAVAALTKSFLATPYRPTGLSTSARALVRLVDELGWLSRIIGVAEANDRDDRPAEVDVVRVAAADVLDQGANLLEVSSHSPVALRSSVEKMRAALEGLERHASDEWPRHRLSLARMGTAEGDPALSEEGALGLLRSLGPSFRAQEVGFAVGQVASNIDFGVAAERRPWRERLAGRGPAGFPGPLFSARERAVSYLEPHSVWLHNSVRGAIALGAAVLVADVTAVQHSFWVVLAALSVLRSNALSTGQSILRALTGTVAGFVAGGAIVALIGHNPDVLWAVLPLAVLFAGFAPTAISFTAGQAGFTLTLVILFNLAQPIGWRVGLVRVEDIALGCGVSLLVGLLFWPRGAAAALRQALYEAYSEAAHYLGRAVDFALGRCDRSAQLRPYPADQAARAAAAARRLDDAFRTYLAERGHKRLNLSEVASLMSGVVGLRLAGQAVLDIWGAEGDQAQGDRAVARRQLRTINEQVTRWYLDFAASLVGPEDVPAPMPVDAAADVALVEALAEDLRDEDGQASAAVRMIWTDDHLHAARRLQVLLVGPARATKNAKRMGRTAWSLGGPRAVLGPP